MRYTISKQDNPKSSIHCPDRGCYFVVLNLYLCLFIYNLKTDHLKLLEKNKHVGSKFFGRGWVDFAR